MGKDINPKDILGREVKVGDYVVWGETSRSAVCLNVGKVLQTPTSDEVAFVMEGKVRESFSIRELPFNPSGPMKKWLKPKAVKAFTGRVLILDKAEGERLEAESLAKAKVADEDYKKLELQWAAEAAEVEQFKLDNIHLCKKRLPTDKTTLYRHWRCWCGEYL